MRRQQHNPPVWKAPRQTEQYGSFPWSVQMSSVHARRPRNSTEKLHACDSPGCGKKFYERCTLFRHQRLKHDRKTKFSRMQLPAFTGSVVVVCDGVSTPPNDAVQPSRCGALPSSRSNAVQPSRSDVLPHSKNHAVVSLQSHAFPPSPTNAVQTLQSDSVQCLQNSSVTLSSNSRL